MSHLLSAMCALAWAYLAAPLVSGWFGIPTPVAWWSRWDALERLGLKPFIFSYGVLTFGMSGFVFSAADALLDGGLSTEAWNSTIVPTTFISAGRMPLMLLIWLAAGLLVGWLTGISRSLLHSLDR